jgi:hypothetical protein
MGDHDSLGRPGRSRGVDERQHVLGLDRAPARLEVDLDRLSFQILERERPLRGAVNADHVLQGCAVAGGEHPLEEPPLANEHPV